MLNLYRYIRQLVKWLRDDWQDYPADDLHPSGMHRRFRSGREQHGGWRHLCDSH